MSHVIRYVVPLSWLLFAGSVYAQDEMKQPELVAPITVRAASGNVERTAPSDAAAPAAPADSGEVKYTLSACESEAEPSGGGEATCGAEPSCGSSSCCSSDCYDLGLDKCWPFCCCCKYGDPWTLEKCLTPCCCDVTYAGFTEIGYHSQNTGLSANDGDALDTNDYPGRVQLQQQYFYVEKKAKTDSCCCDWGYRFDAVYGTNGDTPQAFGNQNNGWDKLWDHGVYGFALPQAYVDLGWNNWDIKIGHFYTPMGYEVFPATGNFFYSHSLSWYNSEPITHSGVLGTYTPNECWTYYAGYTQGWDTAFDSFDGGSDAMAGFAHKISDNLTFTYMFMIGNFGFRSNGEFGYEHTIIADAKLSDKYEYVMESDLVETDGSFGTGQKGEDFEIANYLLYTINDCWKAGFRGEWWKSNQVTGSDVSFYEMTAGVNYKASANLLVRPEVRYDWTPAEQAVTNAQGANFYDRVEFGIDAIYTF
jgi:Putative beta-barrel porin-2, OmpL-like. bbp2